MKSKRKFLISVIIVFFLFLISLRHITVRYVDQYNAAIIPDRTTRILKVPFLLKQSGYHFQKLRYSTNSHLLIVTYKPQVEPLERVKNTRYIGVTFQPTIVPITNHSQTDPFNLSRSYNDKFSGRDTLRILVGNSVDNMQVLSANYPAVNVRDPSILKQGKRYYIIYTRGLMYTEDFNHWKQVSWPTEKQFISSMDWAPEFVREQNGDTSVVMSVCDKGTSRHKLVIAPFKNGHVQPTWVQLSGNLPENTIDPNLQYVHGSYWLCCKNEKTRQLIIGRSDKITGPYQMINLKVNNPKHYSLEGPEVLIVGKHINVFFDTYKLSKNGVPTFYGMHYVEHNLNKSSKRWSEMKSVQTTPSMVFRHGQIIKNQ